MKCDNSCNELKILFCYQAFILFVLLNQLQEVGGNYGRSKLGPASSFAQNWVQSSPIKNCRKNERDIKQGEY